MATGGIEIAIETDADLHGPVAEVVLAGLVAYNTAKLPPSTGRFAVLGQDLAGGGLRAGMSVGLTGPTALSAWGLWTDDTAPGEALAPEVLARAEVEAARRGAATLILYVRPGVPMPRVGGWSVMARAERHDAGLDYIVLAKSLADARTAAPPPDFAIAVVEPPPRPLGQELWRRGDAYRLRRLGQSVRWISAVARREGKVVAGAITRIVGTDAMLDMMWADESLRGTGVGRNTLGAALDAARAAGCVRAGTETMECQALGLYQKLGFVEHAFCPMPVKGAGMHFLQKQL